MNLQQKCGTKMNSKLIQIREHKIYLFQSNARLFRWPSNRYRLTTTKWRKAISTAFAIYISTTIEWPSISRILEWPLITTIWALVWFEKINHFVLQFWLLMWLTDTICRSFLEKKIVFLIIFKMVDFEKFKFLKPPTAHGDESCLICI